MTYEDLDCGITFYPETPTKIRQIKRERNFISRSCEKPECIPGNDQHNCFIGEKHNSDVFLNTYNLWDMVPAALMSLNHTNDRYSMSNKYPQPTTHQARTDSYPVFSSLRTMRSKRKELRVFRLSLIFYFVLFSNTLEFQLKSKISFASFSNLLLQQRTHWGRKERCSDWCSFLFRKISGHIFP